MRRAALTALSGFKCVMQRLAEEGEVDRFCFDRWTFDITEPEFQVRHPVLAGDAGRVFDHAGGVIDRDDLLGSLGQELTEGAFAGSEIRR